MLNNSPRLSLRDTDFVRENLLFNYGMWNDDKLLIESFYSNNHIEIRFDPQQFYFFMTGVHKRFLSPHTQESFSEGVDRCLVAYDRFAQALRCNGYDGNMFLVKIDNSKQMGVLFSPGEEASCTPEELAQKLYQLYNTLDDPYYLDKATRPFASTSFVGPYSGYEQIHRAFLDARRLNDLIFFGVRGRVITQVFYEQTARPCDMTALLASARRLVHLLCSGTQAQALREVDRVLDELVARSYEMTNYQALFIALEDAFAMMETVYAREVRLPHRPMESFRVLSEYKDHLREVIRLLFEQMKGRARYSSTVLMALSYIHRNFESEISLVQTSEYVYANPTALSGEFSAEVGVSFSEYVTNLRVSQAQTLLAQTSLSVEEIARQCGFSSAKYFREVFKRNTGLSPKGWKEQRGARLNK